MKKTKSVSLVKLTSIENTSKLITDFKHSRWPMHSKQDRNKLLQRSKT
jgi:hypothetical protein